MNDLFALTSPNIYIARFFSKEPGPNSTFFKLSARHAFWDLNCYQFRIHRRFSLVIICSNCYTGDKATYKRLQM